MIVSCGDALIDFLPRETKEGALAYQPFVGGSLHNTAIALGRLGVPTGFFDGISTDFFGEMIAESLESSHVDLRYALRPDRPTTLAFVKLEAGHARYVFQDEGTAGRMLTEADIPNFADDVVALHTGSIRLIGEPGASIYETMIARESPRRVISLDPNVRPSLIKDRAAFVARVRRMAAHADIVKLSDEDAEWLSPGTKLDPFARELLNSGVKIVIVTRGSKGGIAFTGRGSVEAVPIKVEVADTVGAGDTFTAGVLTALHRLGKLTKPALAELSEADLDRALSFASRAAAVTVSRPGADPPWAHEM
jgi:fructokinase